MFEQPRQFSEKTIAGKNVKINRTSAESEVNNIHWKKMKTFRVNTGHQFVVPEEHIGVLKQLRFCHFP